MSEVLASQILCKNTTFQNNTGITHVDCNNTPWVNNEMYYAFFWL